MFQIEHTETDVSPALIDNMIYDNARCGVYASGATKAAIRGNYLRGNMLGGVTCWFQCGDTIENNVFVQNGELGVSVLGESRPSISRNLFYGDEVKTGSISGDSPHSEEGDGPVQRGNHFWDADSDGGADAFLDFLVGDYPVLKKGEQPAIASLARSASPWPLHPEELAIIPDGPGRDSTLWKK